MSAPGNPEISASIAAGVSTCDITIAVSSRKHKSQSQGDAPAQKRAVGGPGAVITSHEGFPVASCAGLQVAALLVPDSARALLLGVPLLLVGAISSGALRPLLQPHQCQHQQRRPARAQRPDRRSKTKKKKSRCRPIADAPAAAANSSSQEFRGVCPIGGGSVDQRADGLPGRRSAGAQGAGQVRSALDWPGNARHGRRPRVGRGAGRAANRGRGPAAAGARQRRVHHGRAGVRDPGAAVSVRRAHAQGSGGALLQGVRALPHALRPLPARAQGRPPGLAAAGTHSRLARHTVLEAP